MSKVYIVTAPEHIRGTYATWAACKQAVEGVPGARFQAVSTPEEANAILHEGGISLPSGVYAFVDGNAQGGVGVVLVMRRDVGQATHEVSTTVRAVFGDLREPVAALETPEAIDRALAKLHNVLAELAAAYQAIRMAPSGTPLTLVYDYMGIGAWLQGTWKTRDHTVEAIVEAMRALANRKGLELQFRHQPGHRSTHAGPNEYAAFNARADALATAAVAGLEA